MKKLILILIALSLAMPATAEVMNNPDDVAARLMGLHSTGGNKLAFNDDGTWGILPDPENMRAAYHDSIASGSGRLILEVFTVDTAEDGQIKAREMFPFTVLYSDYDTFMETLKAQVEDGATGFYRGLYDGLPVMQEETGKVVQHIVHGFIDDVMDAEYWRKKVSTKWKANALYTEFKREGGETVVLIASPDGMFTLVFLA